VDVLAPAVLTLLGAFGLVLRWKKGRLLTAAAGWHGTIFLMYGASALAHLVAPPESRIPLSFLLPAYQSAIDLLVLGQAIALAVDFWLLRRSPRIPPLVPRDRTFRVAVLISALALTGYVGLRLGLGGAGAETVFPVLRLLRYPSIIFLVVSARRPGQRVVATTFVLVSLAFSIASVWRSELVFIVVAVLLGIGLRRARLVPRLAIAGLLAFVFLLPFLNARKKAPDAFLQAPFAFFLESQQVGLLGRTQDVLGFIATRTNQGRDLAHLLVALDTGDVRSVGGQYYLDLVSQMVPRLLWPDKPSFSYQTGFVLPRVIGLLGADDPDTSWGLGLLGELVYAHGRWVLVPAVPLVLLLLIGLEIVTARIRWRNWEFRHVVGATFFFLFLGSPGLINLTTYVIWLFLFAVLTDRFAHASWAMGRVVVPASVRSVCRTPQAAVRTRAAAADAGTAPFSSPTTPGPPR
jgi:hypothetical protein